jgi:hypothetical protein
MSPMDWMADIEGDALAFAKMTKVSLDSPPSLVRMCREITGFAPLYAKLVHAQGYYGPAGRSGVKRVLVIPGLPPDQERFVLGHEISHAFYDQTGYVGDDIEERCDALSAALCAPRGPFGQALRDAGGHRVHALAKVFQVPRCLAALRAGEVTGRPVAYPRPKKAPIIRGQAFGWPPAAELARAARRPPEGVHPVRVERGHVLMAKYDAWRTFAA